MCHHVTCRATPRGRPRQQVVGVQLFGDVPRHSLALHLPAHHLQIASSEQALLFTVILAGSVMPVPQGVTQ